MIRYRVEPDDLHTHHWRVTLTVAQPAAETVVSLPVWIAGSYMVREFGRHLSALQARQGSRTVAVEALDKTSWALRCSGRTALTLSRTSRSISSIRLQAVRLSLALPEQRASSQWKSRLYETKSVQWSSENARKRSRPASVSAGAVFAVWATAASSKT